VISAVGVVGNIENLGLEKTRRQDRSRLRRDRRLRKNQRARHLRHRRRRRPPMLAHKAEHEGVICIEAIKACIRTP